MRFDSICKHRHKLRGETSLTCGRVGRQLCTAPLPGVNAPERLRYAAAKIEKTFAGFTEETNAFSSLDKGTGL